MPTTLTPCRARIARAAAAFAALALLSVVQASWKTPREHLDRVLIAGEFRLFYTYEGDDAIPPRRRGDSDGNGQPDFVDDIALQLTTASHLFTEELGLTHPLRGERYRGHAKFFDIHIMAIDGNGSSGDAVVEYRYRTVDVERAGALTMTISNTLPDGNLTPAHELFHAFQNGYTLFKNRWYTEGTARWSEYALRKGTGRQQRLPQSEAALAALLEETYGAKVFWNRLAYLCDGDGGRFTLPQPAPHYLGLKTAVVEDDTLYGSGFMRRILERFAAVDDAAGRHFGRDTDGWREKAQKSHQNDPFLLCAIRTEVASACDTDGKAAREIAGFIATVDAHTDGACPRLLGVAD